MKRFFYLSTVFFLFLACGNSQPIQQPTSFTGDIKSDVNLLLPEGTVTADIMGVKKNPRIVELTQKFQMSVQKNYDWFMDYMQTVPDGQQMPYHPNLGLTEAEYKEYLASMKDVELISTGKTEVSIKKDGDAISFEATGKFELLNYIRINLDKNIVNIDVYELRFSDTSNIKDDKNAFKSKWKGYRWQMQEPNDDDIKAREVDISSMDLKLYSFEIGQIEKSGKTFITLKVQEMEKGVVKIDAELIMLL